MRTEAVVIALCSGLSLLHCATTQTQTVTMTTSIVANANVAMPITAPAEPVAFAGGTNVPLSIAQARGALSSYGEWQSTSLGSVWFPEIARQEEFEPYLTHGQWTQNPSQQLQWNSTLPWGSVTFHYGRWVSVGGRWGWVYGDSYAPAWVDWRVADGYLGWTARGLGPAAATTRWSWVTWESLYDAMLPRRSVRGARAEMLLSRSRELIPQVGPSPGVGYFPPAGDNRSTQSAQFRTVVIQDEQALENYQQLMDVSTGPTIASTVSHTNTANYQPNSSRSDGPSARQPSFASTMWSDQERARTPIVARYSPRYRMSSSVGAVAVPGESSITVAVPSNTTAGSQFVIPVHSTPTSSGAAGGSVGSTPVFSGYTGTPSTSVSVRR